MICTNCKKGNMKESVTTYFRKVNENYFIIENVPCHICDECGEITYSLNILEIIEQIISNTKDIEKANIIQYDRAA